MIFCYDCSFKKLYELRYTKIHQELNKNMISSSYYIHYLYLFRCRPTLSCPARFTQVWKSIFLIFQPYWDTQEGYYVDESKFQT